jgi:hypothetical protein
MLPPFRLVESGGEPLDRAGLDGRVWLIGFLDTGCTACAERLGSALERVQYRIRNVGSAVGILEVAMPSDNPVVDVAGERSRHHANPRQWLTASGPDARRLLAEMGALSLSHAAGLEAGGAVALVDGKGRVRAVEGVEAADALNRLVSATTLILNIR